MKRNDENSVILAVKNNKKHDIKDRKGWLIIDSGSTSHMKNSLEGLYYVKEEHSKVIFGNDNSDEKVRVIGKKDLIFENMDGGKHKITIENVGYLENLCCNVISPSLIKLKGWKILDRNENISVIKNNFRMDFHVNYEVVDSYLMGLKVIKLRKNLSCVTVKELQEKLVHPRVTRVINTSYDNNIKLRNKIMDPCE